MMLPSRRLHRIILGIAILFLALADIAAYTYYYYDAPGPLPEQTTVLFKKGMGFREIVDDLAEKDIIRHPLLFKAIAVATGDARKFNAGEYHFSAAISPRLIMSMIAEGRVVVHRLTIPEGLRVQAIIDMINQEPALEGQPSAIPHEGELLPETYHFVYGDSRGELITRMKTAMQSAVEELWKKRKAGVPIATPEQAVTLASIVEKETSIDAERGRIAAVFINRLRKGMKLQSDPTVIYAIEKDKGPLGRLLVSSDLKYDSPYNTYQNYGLPPGPIANPGRASLEAVLNPPDTTDLYFVATGTGGHNFSATLDSHNKNVREYRKQVKLQQQKATPAAASPQKK